jgi:hypothetical protein
MNVFNMDLRTFHCGCCWRMYPAIVKNWMFVCRYNFLYGHLQGSWRVDSGLSDALTLKQHQRELFFWVLTPSAGGSGVKGNGPEHGYVTSDIDEGNELSMNNTMSMPGIDAEAPPALYRICESRLYRANVQDSSSIEFSYQVTFFMELHKRARSNRVLSNI